MFRFLFAAIARALRVVLGLVVLPFDWLFGARAPETADLAVARHAVADAIDEEQRGKEMETQLAAAEQHEIEEERLAALRAARKASMARRTTAQVVAFPDAADEPGQADAPAPRM